MTRALSMMMVALVLGLSAFGCDSAPVDPATGMVVLYASVDQRRASNDTAALNAPLRRDADDPHSYTALLARASDEFGADPSRVTVRDLSIVLDDQDWIIGFDDLFAGDLEVRFQPLGGGASHLVATIPWEKVQRSGAAIVVKDAGYPGGMSPGRGRLSISPAWPLLVLFAVSLAAPARAQPTAAPPASVTRLTH
jgi:hypothetical protein